MDQRVRPGSGHFSSGPCAKRPGWNTHVLENATVGRSHRSPVAKAKLKRAIQQTRDVLGIPENYLIGIVPGSDTGAMEIALWNLLGPSGVDVLCWESFGKDWMDDVIHHLALADSRVHSADYGQLPDLAKVNQDNDVVFVWNGTTSGVRLPDGEWIAEDRKGLTLCDATSAVFAMPIPWSRLDAVTFSWQKALGGEAGFGMLVLSPRAVDRINSFHPPWPIPKLFRLRKGDTLNEAIFNGDTINTVSMLCVEDYLDALCWASEKGGLDGLIQRSLENFRLISEWVDRTDWIDFLASDPLTRSNTSVCLQLTADWFTDLDSAQQREFMQSLTALLEQEQVAFDINAYRAAPPGLRIWAGATVESRDLEALFPWIEWACGQVRNKLSPGLTALR